MEKLRAVWDEVIDSLWFLPAIITAACVGLAALLIRFDSAITEVLDPDLWFIFAGTSTGAQGVLQAIATSIITVTGVVFSVTIVVLQLASSQFTPRVLRQFMADRGNQIVLGVFIGTFTYTLLVQRTIRGENGDEFVPNAAITGAVLLALTSVGFLIFFINHAARAVQASVVIEAVFRDTMGAIRLVFPERLTASDDGRITDANELAIGDGQYRAVPARKAGYVQAVATTELRSFARKHDITVRTELEIGEHVLPGRILFTIWPDSRLDDDDLTPLCDAVVLGIERTQYQDIKYGVIELMDIAVKAMSPSVNDPTTAINVIDRAAALLLELAWRRRGDTVDRDPDGWPLLVTRKPRLEETVDTFFNQVRHYGAGDPAVAVKLVQTLTELIVLSPVDARLVFRPHLDHVLAAARQRIEDDIDLKRLRAAEIAARARIDQDMSQDRDDAYRELSARSRAARPRSVIR